MRAVRLLFGLLVAAFITLGATWLTYKNDYVLHERAAAEWTALTLMQQALEKGQQPANADAAAFLSNAALDKALNQLVGAIIKPPAATVGDLTVTIKNAHVRPDVGLTGVIVDMEVASAQRGISVKMAVEGNLTFRGISTQKLDGDHPLTTAKFAVSIVKAEPQLKWGFLDVPGRRFVSEAVASGLMLALDGHLAVSIPFEDRLALDTSFSNESVVPTSAGSVTLNTRLPGKTLEQRFNMATPLFIRSGVWLLATASASGQAAIAAPADPKLPTGELDARVAALRDNIAKATQAMEQTHDLVLFVRGSTLVGLLDQIKNLPAENRTVTIQSVKTTGQLVSDGKSYVELRDPTSATAHLVIGPPTAQWLPRKGAAVSVDLHMDLNAKVHAHINPLPVGGGAGTTVDLRGGAGTNVSGTLQLSNSTVAGHSVLLLGLSMPCDSVTAEVKTDGRVVIGPLKTDLISIGLRWTMPVPQTLGQPTLVLDDLPRRFPLHIPEPGKDDVTITLAHGAVEYVVRVTGAEAQPDGYIITADLDMRPVDGLNLPVEIAAQKGAIAKGLDAVRQTAAACPSVQPDMKVMLGDMEINGNGEIAKAFRNILSDLQNGPGPSNDLVGKDGAVAKALDNARKDVTQGPGDHNDLVGKDGAVRSNLRQIPLVGKLF